jgi:hypothetical protein
LKAAADLATLTARQEAAPFQNNAKADFSATAEAVPFPIATVQAHDPIRRASRVI